MSDEEQAKTETPEAQPAEAKEVLLAEIRVRSDGKFALHYSKQLVADMPDFLIGTMDLLTSLLLHEFKDEPRRADVSLADTLGMLVRSLVGQRMKYHQEERAGIVRSQLPKILRAPAGARVKH